jgi:hypothetical protein
MSKKIIKGVEIDEIEDLDYNLNKLRVEIRSKLSFNALFEKVIHSLKGSTGRGRIGFLSRLFVSIMLVPYYIFTILASNKRMKAIKEGEEELINYYANPENKVRRFRLQCSQEKEMYREEIQEIDLELEHQKKNLALTSVGETTRKTIENLISEFEDNRQKKQRKLEFYTKCEERLLHIESQFKIKKSILKSKEKLLTLQESEGEENRKIAIEKEFAVFDFYGYLLDELSDNLKKVGQDKGEVIEELELNEMLVQIGKIHV